MNPCLDYALAIGVLGEEVAAVHSHDSLIYNTRGSFSASYKKLIVRFRCINQLSYKPTVEVLVNTTQNDTIQYNTIQYNTIQYNTIQYNTIQYNTIQYNTIQSVYVICSIYVSEMKLMWASVGCLVPVRF